jgi:hypothetical protein
MGWRTRSTLWATLLIAAGVLLLLRETTDRFAGVSVWPVLLAVIGLWLAVERLSVGDQRGFAVPLVLVAVGVFYLLRETNSIDANVSIWPVLLIALGAAVLLSMLPGKRRARRRSAANEVAEPAARPDGGTDPSVNERG